MTLGQRIKRERESKHLGLNEFAKLAGVRAALVSELETGKLADTTGKNLARMARALGVSMDYLYGLYEEQGATTGEREAAPVDTRKRGHHAGR